MKVRMTYDDKVREALRRAPATMSRHVGKGLLRGGIEIARLARRKAPKALSTLTQSINQQRVSNFRVDVVAAMNYATAVEEGAKPGGWVPTESLLAWIRVRQIKPRREGMDVNDLAYLIQQKIFRKGTKAQPFMEPARKEKEIRVGDLVDQSVGRAIASLGL